MQFKAKKLLVILQLNETLLFINNRKSKYVEFGANLNSIKYDDSHENYDILYRKGKRDFLDYAFGIEKQKIDFAIWTNLDQKIAEPIAKKYFHRYYRQLLFMIAANRGLYTQGSRQQTSISIPKQLNNVYSRFNGYDGTNTVVVSSTPNTLQGHLSNQIILPPFNPLKINYQNDIGALVLQKYLKGIVSGLDSTSSSKDIRQFISMRPIDKLSSRFSARYQQNPQYH